MQKRFALTIVLTALAVLGLVGGMFYWRRQPNQPIIREPLPTAAAQGVTAPESQPDPTANWKTYTDADFGVSFRYPTTWTFGGVRKDPANGKNGEALFEAGNGYEVHFNAYDNPNHLSYAALMKQFYPALAARYTKVILEPVTTVNGVQFQRVRIPAEERGNIVFQQKGRYYVIASGAMAATNRQKVNPLHEPLRHILATFRFTN